MSSYSDEYNNPHENGKNCAMRLQREYNIRAHYGLAPTGLVGINGLRITYSLKESPLYKSATELLNFLGEEYNKASKLPGGARMVIHTWNKKDVVLNGQVQETVYYVSYDIVTEGGSYDGSMAPKKWRSATKLVEIKRDGITRRIPANWWSTYRGMGWVRTSDGASAEITKVPKIKKSQTIKVAKKDVTKDILRKYKSSYVRTGWKVVSE